MACVRKVTSALGVVGGGSFCPEALIVLTTVVLRDRAANEAMITVNLETLERIVAQGRRSGTKSSWLRCV